MFGNMFGFDDFDKGDKGGGGCGFNCSWVILLLLFCCCCGGKMKNFSLHVNPCCLILLLGLLFCTGGIKFNKDC